ncbi:MAG: EAL domain-containing protein [Pseudomonadota bacterium]
MSAKTDQLEDQHTDKQKSIRKLFYIQKLLYVLIAFVLMSASLSHALEPIIIGEDQEQIDITIAGELYEGRGDSLQVETAPGADGIAGRMSVQASTLGTNPNWIVFALSNPTNRRIERWLTADRYSIINSGILWSNLDSGYLTQLTPSLGFRPERIENDDTDIFKIELEPGATVTFVAELVSDRFPRLYLWKTPAFEKKLRNITLFRGILLGVTGLLAVFLTAVFVANHKAVFPATAIFAWAVTAYLCVDFGFWHKLFQLKPEDNAMYRAAAEASIAASLILFLYTFLRLSLWHKWIRLVFGVWLIAQVFLVFFAIIDARVAASFARLSFLTIASTGSILIFYLALRGQDRALSLVPSWFLFLVWIFACAVTILGHVSGDIFVAGIVAGLVLIVLLFGFTVTQFAFRSNEMAFGGLSSKLYQGSLALHGPGSAIWEWNAKRDSINVSEEIDEALGLPHGTLSCPVEEWVKHLHQADVDRFKTLLSSFKEQNGGEARLEFRLRRSDNSYTWYELSANCMPESQYRSLKCAGILRDITHTKQSLQRLMHDAIHDSLTHLPNKELFLDRLATSITRTQEEGANRPIVIFIDIDKFKDLNNSLGFGIGDTMLLIVARRLARYLSPLDTLGRIGSDQFGIILVTETEAQQIAMLAERVRRSLRSPMKISGKEIILTGSIGISVFDGHQTTNKDLLREAEMAMYRAKKAGSDRIEMFNPSMRDEKNDRLALETELHRAIDKGQIKILYQPVMQVEDEELCGFDTVITWEHPRLGTLNAHDFLHIAEDTGLIGQLGSYVLDRASRQTAKWQKILRRDEEPLFVSVDISNRHVFRHDLIKDFHYVLKREILPKGALRLAIAESLVMENPEHASEILGWLKSAGASLILDNFGAGYSSLSYLDRFPFDIIRLDKSLIENKENETTAFAIARSIVKLAHDLGKDVAANNIQSEEEVFILQSLNCEYMQGSLYGDPLTDREVTNLLNTVKKSSKSASKKKKLKQQAQASQASPKQASTQINNPQSYNQQQYHKSDVVSDQYNHQTQNGYYAAAQNAPEPQLKQRHYQPQEPEVVQKLHPDANFNVPPRQANTQRQNAIQDTKPQHYDISQEGYAEGGRRNNAQTNQHIPKHPKHAESAVPQALANAMQFNSDQPILRPKGVIKQAAFNDDIPDGQNFVAKTNEQTAVEHEVKHNINTKPHNSGMPDVMLPASSYLKKDKANTEKAAIKTPSLQGPQEAQQKLSDFNKAMQKQMSSVSRRTPKSLKPKEEEAIPPHILGSLEN